MKEKTKITLLIIIGILILITISMQAAYAFLGFDDSNSSTSSIVNLNTCAQLKFGDENLESISLTNTYPMDDMFGLQTVPYKFIVSSNCDGSSSYSIYLFSLDVEPTEKALEDTAIHYALRDGDSKLIISEGVLNPEDSELTADEDFNSEDMNQFGLTIGKQAHNIYKLYQSTISKDENKNYYLYLWVDKSVDDSATMDKTFSATVGVKNN